MNETQGYITPEAIHRAEMVMVGASFLIFGWLGVVVLYELLRPIKKREPMRELVTMRLADMHRIHPQQDNSRVCRKCGERVGIFPSGQMALKRYPEMTIICQVCHGEGEPPDYGSFAPGAIEEARETVPRELGAAEESNNPTQH